MTDSEWLATSDPRAMLKYVVTWDHNSPLGQRPWRPSDRKLRLFAVACCRLAGTRPAVADEYEARGFFEDEYPKDLHSDQSWAMGWTELGCNRPTMSVRADLLRDIVSPFRRYAVSPCHADDYTPGMYQFIRPERLTSAVKALAQAIYDERRFEEMPILADALEEAGCKDETLLGHMRGRRKHMLRTDDGVLRETWLDDPRPHVRGCWALDVILGLE